MTEDLPEYTVPCDPEERLLRAAKDVLREYKETFDITNDTDEHTVSTFAMERLRIALDIYTECKESQQEN